MTLSVSKSRRIPAALWHAGASRQRWLYLDLGVHRRARSAAEAAAAIG